MIIIHIIHIFLFHTASANLIAYFLLNPMGVYFLHYWPALPGVKIITRLRVTAIGFIIYPTFTIAKPYKYMPNSPLRSIYCIINYTNLLYISTGIPKHVKKLKLLYFRTEKVAYIYEKSASVWNQSQDLQYYTNANNPSNNYVCGKLVDCLTYHKRITI